MVSIFNIFKRPGAAVAAADVMPATVTPAGMTTGARPLQNPAGALGYSPAAMDGILTRAETGEENAVAEYFKLADRVVEREMQVGGVLNGLVLAVAALAHKAVPLQGDKSKRAQKLSEEISQLLKPSSALRLVAPGVISQGLSHGIGTAAAQWNTLATPWVPVKFTQKPAHFFTFDRTDGFTPLLRNVLAGQPAQPISPGTAIVFTPRRNAAMQVKNGLAWALCWAYQIKSAVLADELLFVQTFGHPLVVGKYPRNTEPADISMLQRAVSQLNATSRGVFRNDLEIEFKEIARSNTDIYEKVLRYVDELISKIIWANTLSSDVGKSGSHALGKVHSEAKWDVIKSVAQQWAACLQEFFDAYIVWNYGPDAPKVEIVVDVEDAQDMLVMSQVIKNLHDAGVPLVATEIRETFGFSEPQPGDELLGAGAPAAQSPALPPVPAAKAPNGLDLGRGCPVHSAQSQGPVRDAIDDLADAMLSDWAVISSSIDASLQSAAAGASNIDDLRASILASVNAMDVTALTALLTKARLSARLAGDLGADI
jgi:phage gp29-like protein